MSQSHGNQEESEVKERNDLRGTVVFGTKGYDVVEAF